LFIAQASSLARDGQGQALPLQSSRIKSQAFEIRNKSNQPTAISQDLKQY
jgi:hypothetical protein